MKTFKIAVLPGDGIGNEIVPPAADLCMDVAKKTGGFTLDMTNIEAGAALYARTGVSFPEESFQVCKQSDAILLGAMGLPSVRNPDGREIAPQLELRERLQLYAGVRPVKAYKGVPPVLANSKFAETNFVMVRESTEGLFAFRTNGIIENDETAREVMQLTRKGLKRVYDFSFKLAQSRKKRGFQGKLTLVDKANVFRSFKWARGVFDEEAKNYQDIKTEYCYVDAMAMNLVKNPWRYDVMVMENMFGDILSDLGAGIMGGLGMAPSADIGDENAVFQPCHGSAPDIAGQNKANPIATFLSAAMMLDWLGERDNVPQALQAGKMIEKAVEQALEKKVVRPQEFGGDSGTTQITEGIRNELAKL